jgi:glyoxylase-like metal-dependent hydrolase (beta-lactamase superfamily II)
MCPRQPARILLLLGLLACACSLPPYRRDTNEPPGFPARWIDGTDPAEPPIQVHRYAPGFWILRQSLRTNFEGPFLYLYAGEERALLVDTGAGGIPLRETVEGLLAGADDGPRAGRELELIVAHSHAHGDHVAGDGQFADRPNTTIVGHEPRDVWDTFGLGEFGEAVGELDLGGRVLDVLSIPGHELSSIAIYDRASRTLMTGDTVYPGRLYVEDWPLFVLSVRRLVEWCDAHPVEWVLGTHIEMTAEPGVDFRMRAVTHTNERRLELTPEDLRELLDACLRMGDGPEREALDDFVIYPVGD